MMGCSEEERTAAPAVKSDVKAVQTPQSPCGLSIVMSILRKDILYEQDLLIR